MPTPASCHLTVPDGSQCKKNTSKGLFRKHNWRVRLFFLAGGGGGAPTFYLSSYKGVEQGFSQDIKIGCPKWYFYAFRVVIGCPVPIYSIVNFEIWEFQKGSKIRIGCPKDRWMGLWLKPRLIEAPRFCQILNIIKFTHMSNNRTLRKIFFFLPILREGQGAQILPTFRLHFAGENRKASPPPPPLPPTSTVF